MDEFAFQKHARSVWRSHREQFDEIQATDIACAVVTSDCLALDSRGSSSTDWFADLQRKGARTYLVHDTYLDQPSRFQGNELLFTFREEIPCQA